MTPLIDVVFLLIVFFVLVSRIVDEDRPRLDLPSPVPPATLISPQGPKLIVSVVSDGSGAWQYHLAGADMTANRDGAEMLERSVAAQLRRAPETAIQVRAGQTTPWEIVSPVLQAARAAGRAAALPHPVRVQLATTRRQGT
jgi:biopolymer transport protein ExbD